MEPSVDMQTKFYIHPQEVWDKEKCEKMAKRRAKDGLGTPYPFKGYIGNYLSAYSGYGKIRYNGLCFRNGEWYNGEIRPLPLVADGYEIVEVPRWGYRIRRKGSE